MTASGHKLTPAEVTQPPSRAVNYHAFVHPLGLCLRNALRGTRAPRSALEKFTVEQMCRGTGACFLQATRGAALSSWARTETLWQKVP